MESTKKVLEAPYSLRCIVFIILLMYLFSLVFFCQIIIDCFDLKHFGFCSMILIDLEKGPCITNEMYICLAVHHPRNVHKMPC